MNLLEIFKKKQEPTISKESFINEVPPVQVEADELISEDLKSFIGFNYERKGIEDGFKYHNRNYKNLYSKSIIEKSIILIEKVVNKLEDDKQSIMFDIIDAEGLNEDILNKLKSALERINKKIEYSRELQIMVQNNQGFIRSILADYEIGYEQGASAYFESNEFLKSAPLF